MSLSSRLMSLGFLGVLFALTAVKYVVLPINPDNSIHLKAARTILEKGSLYPHLYEVNPPLFPYLSVVPVFLARVTGGTEIFFYDLSVFCLAVLVLAVIVTELRKVGLLKNPSEATMVLAAWIVILVGIQGTDFGQRDHIIGILIFPYVVHLGLRAHGLGRGALRPLPAVLLALAIAIKPQFFPVWFLGELWVMFRLRSMVPVRSTGNILIVLTGFTYLALVMVLEPLFYTDILPIARKAYSAYGRAVGAGDLVRWLGLTGVQVLASVVLSRSGDEQTRALRINLAISFFLTAQGAAIGFLLQAHYNYQMWPFIMMSIAGLPLLLANYGTGPAEEQRGARHTISTRIAPAFFVLVLIAATPSWVWSKAVSSLWDEGRNDAHPWARTYVDLAAQVALIERYAANDGYYVMSSNVFTSFPAEYYSSASWPMRYPVLWPLPGLAGREDPEYVQLADKVRHQVAEDLVRHRPALILVDVSEEKSYFLRDSQGKQTFDYLEFFNQSEVFREAFWNYTPCGNYVLNGKITFRIYVDRAGRSGKEVTCNEAETPELESRG